VNAQTSKRPRCYIHYNVINYAKSLDEHFRKTILLQPHRETQQVFSEASEKRIRQQKQMNDLYQSLELAQAENKSLQQGPAFLQQSLRV
jgi:hypothetical protein